MKKISYIFAAAVLGLLAVSSCTDLTQVKDDINDLKSRVGALEIQLESLNSNVEALSALVGGGTINSVSEQSGVYTIILSNGEQLVINQGSVGIGNAPVVSIDNEGYWMADYQDGKGAQPILKGTEKVSAYGEDGITPKFGVDKDGYWTVSYDEGATYSNVLDENGGKVKALPDNTGTDSYFSDVSFTSDVLTLTLKNGKSYSIPVVSDFLCRITGAEALVEFGLGETRSFALELKGAAQTFVTAPEGWQASVTETMLKVTSPSSVTKATIADSRTDVTVLAFSAQGYSAVAKVKVQISGAALLGDPVATVSSVSTTEETATFSVALDDASEYYYTVLASTEKAPDVLTVISTGTKASATSVVASGLGESTEYICYVVPVNSAKNGSVASASATTKAIYDKYNAYVSGKTLMICGKAYSKAVNGEATLLVADGSQVTVKTSVHDKTGVFFLETKNGGSFITATDSQIQITKDIAIIGRYSEDPVKISQYRNWQYRGGTLAFCNILIDNTTEQTATGRTTYVMTYSNEPTKAKDAVLFQSCTFLYGTNNALNAFNYTSNGQFPKVTRFCGCTFDLSHSSSGQLSVFNTGGDNMADNNKTAEEVTYSGNLFIGRNNCAIRLFLVGTKTPSSGNEPKTVFTLKNNTFYNISSNNGLVQTQSCSSFTATKNIFVENGSGLSKTGFVLKIVDATTVVPTVDISDNIVYGNWKWNPTSGGQFTQYTGIDTVTDLPLANPAGEDFSPVSKYSSYGYQK